MAQVRQNYHEESEANINKQINLELYASYAYLSMAYHFDRDDIGLKNAFKFFKTRSDEEREHANKFLKYQNMRGGRVKLQDVKAPENSEWGTLAEAMKSALDLERHVNQALLDLHVVAEKHGDSQLMDWLEGEFLKEQVADIKELGDYVTNLRMVGPGLGEFMFDKETLGD